MKITLISPYDDILANGLRVISSCLKEKGHNVDVIFLSSEDRLSQEFSTLYNEEIFNNLCGICKDSDLIGFSLMTNYFVKVADLTKRMKEKLDIPIIWGGIHPTVKPEECLEYADMVCVGEGEDAMIELADKLKTRDITKIKNIWINDNGTIIKNEVRELEENLDKYPFQDYDLDTHYTLNGNNIVKMTYEMLEAEMPTNEELGLKTPEYGLMTARGCPHNCAYCNNNALRKVYAGKGKYLRNRSNENMILEIEEVKKKFPFIKKVNLLDDTFFFRPKKEIEEFSKLYKERIDLPFRCAVSPSTLSEEKLKCMIDAGLYTLSLGIQSLNQETLINIYSRHTPRKVILEAVRILTKYREYIPTPFYHIITSNPYESDDSIKDSIRFVSTLPDGVRVLLYPLSFYPGTELYERAINDGTIKNEIDEIYLMTWDKSKAHVYSYLFYILFFTAYLNDHRIFTRSRMKKFTDFAIRDDTRFLFDSWIMKDILSLMVRFSYMFWNNKYSSFSRLWFSRDGGTGGDLTQKK